MTYLTDKQVAERLTVSTATIRRWVRAGKFPRPVKLEVGTVRWLEASLSIWEHEKANAIAETSEADAAHQAIEDSDDI
jgi:prophage regulatory protein